MKKSLWSMAAILPLFLAGFAYRTEAANYQMPIAFAGYTNRAETLTNFPVLVVLSNNVGNSGFTYSNYPFLSTNGWDLRFKTSLTATGTNTLNYEIESWNTNGASYVWVQVPMLQSNGQSSIWATWGATNDSTQLPCTTNGATWSNGFVGVYHMSRTNTQDSTTYANSASPVTGVTATNGVADGANYFNGGSSSYADIPNSTSLNGITNQLTISAFYRRDSADSSAWGAIACKSASGSSGLSWILQDAKSANPAYSLSFTISTSGSAWGPSVAAPVGVTYGTWYYASGIYNGSQIMLMTNGVVAGTAAASGNIYANAIPTCIGGCGGYAAPSFPITGIIDEFRISNVARSTNWVWAEYMNMASNTTTFQTYAAATVVSAAGTPVITNLAPSNIVSGSAVLNGQITSTGSAPVTAVSVCWGPTDGGTNASAWSNVTSFAGSSWNQGDVLATNIATLVTNQDYFYTYYASNAVGGAWATPSSIYFTEGALTLAAPDPLCGASATDTATVVVSRPATCTNGALTVYYTTGGAASNGVNYTASPASGSLVMSNGQTNATITLTPKSLDPGLPLSLTVSLAVGSYVIGSPSNVTCTCGLPGGWAFNAPIGFSGYSRAETLTNFPALVMLSNNCFSGFAYSQFRSGTNDLAFTADAEGLTNLNYEIEAWNTNGQSRVWVQVPALTSNTTITAWWGAPGQVAQACTTNGATWSNGFMAVWHMGQSNTLDSTANNAPGASYGNTNVTGFIGTGQGFNGSSAYINESASGFANFANGLTVSLWANPSSAATWARFVDFGRGQGSDNILLARNGSTANLSFQVYSGSTAGNLVTLNNGLTLNTWQHLAVTETAGGAVVLYTNGAQGATGTTTVPANIPRTQNYVGRSNWSSDSYYAGLIDELRISSVARSTNWVWAEYMNMASNSPAFQTYGMAVSMGPTPPTVIDLAPSNVVSGSAVLNGQITSTGSAPVTAVSVYWGPTDGGTNVSAWSNTTVLAGSSWNQGDVLVTNITLVSGQDYFYTYYASNAVGGAWATPSSMYFTEGALTLAAPDSSCGFTPTDTATVVVSRPANCNGALTVYYTTGGAASNSVNYTASPASGTLQFNAGSTSAVITITPLAPWNTGAAKNFTVALTNGSYLIGSANTATCTLQTVQPTTYTWDGSAADWTLASHWTGGYSGLLPVGGSTGLIASGTAQISTTSSNLYNAGMGETPPAEIRIQTGGRVYYDRRNAGSIANHNFVLDGGAFAPLVALYSTVSYDYDLRVRSLSVIDTTVYSYAPSGWTLNGAIRDYDATHIGRVTALMASGNGFTLNSSNAPFTGGWLVTGAGTIQAGAVGALGSGAIVATNAGAIAWTTGGDSNMPSISLAGGSSLWLGNNGHYNVAPGNAIALQDGSQFGTMWTGDGNYGVYMDAPLQVSGNITFTMGYRYYTLYVMGDISNAAPATITINWAANQGFGGVNIGKTNSSYSGNWNVVSVGLPVLADGALGTGQVTLWPGTYLSMSRSLSLYNLIGGNGTLGSGGQTLTLQPRYRNATLTDAGVAPGSNAVYVTGILTNAGNLALASLTNYDGVSGSNAYCKVKIAMATNAAGVVQASQVQVLGSLTGLSNADLVVTAPYFLPTSTNTILTATNNLAAQRFHSVSFNIATQSFRVLYVGSTVQVVVDRPYTLTYTAGGGGTIGGTSPQTVLWGTTGTVVTATPNSGYNFVGWSDGVATSNRQDGPITNDVSVTANFQAAALDAIANLPPTNLGSGTATLNGHLVLGSDAPTVYVYWGPADGRTNAAEWSNVAAFAAGQWAQGSSPATNLIGLAEQGYFYTYAVSNSGGIGWASPSVYFSDGALTLVATDASCGTTATDTATLVVSRPSDCTNGDLTVNYTTAGGVTNGVNYTASPANGSLVISNGQTNATITITPQAPWNTSTAMTFTVSLTAGPYRIGSPNTATCTYQAWITVYTAKVSGVWNAASTWNPSTGFPQYLADSAIINSCTVQATAGFAIPSVGLITVTTNATGSATGTLWFADTTVQTVPLLLNGGMLTLQDDGTYAQPSNAVTVNAASQITLIGQGNHRSWTTLNFNGAFQDSVQGGLTNTGAIVLRGSDCAGMNLNNASTNFSGGWDILVGPYLDSDGNRPALNVWADGALGSGTSLVRNALAIYSDQTNAPAPARVIVPAGAELWQAKPYGDASYRTIQNWEIELQGGALGSGRFGQSQFLGGHLTMTSGSSMYGHRDGRAWGPDFRYGGIIVGAGRLTIDADRSGSGSQIFRLSGNNTNFSGGVTVLWNALYVENICALGTGDCWFDSADGISGGVYLNTTPATTNWVLQNNFGGISNIWVQTGTSAYTLTVPGKTVEIGTNVTAIGQLTINGNLAFSTNASGGLSTLIVDLAGPGGAGSNYDQLVVTHALTNLSNAAMQVRLAYAPAPSDGFTVVTAGALSGQFALGATVDCGTYGGAHYYGTAMYGATSVTLTNIAVRPAITNLAATNILTTSACMNASLTSTGTATTTVTLYWGPADGATNAASWSNAVPFGLCAAGPIGTTVSGLTPDTIYWYTYSASNVAGLAWGQPSSTTFRTYSAPVISNGLGVTGLGTTAATLHGYLYTTGSSPTRVWINWGTDTNNWANSADLGYPGLGAFSYTAANLYYGLRYAYNCSASNVWGAVSTTPSNFVTPRPAVSLIDTPASVVTTTSAVLNATLACPGAVYGVSVYWNTSNGGTNAAAWGNLQTLGGYTNQASRPLAFALSGLAPLTTYNFTFRATNALEDLWATNVLSFSTYGAPQVDNGVGPTNVGVNRATLTGQIVTNGGASAEAFIYWGRTDQATTGIWDNVIDMSLQSGAFATNLTGLRESQVYYYRCYATNIWGSGWAPVSTNFTTLEPPGSIYKFR